MRSRLLVQNRLEATIPMDLAGATHPSLSARPRRHVNDTICRARRLTSSLKDLRVMPIVLIGARHLGECSNMGCGLLSSP